MKITILSLRGPTNNGIRGGAREYIQEISKGLAKAGHNVRIVCGCEPKQNLYKSEKIDGIEIVRVGKTKWSVYSIIKYYIKYLKHDTDILIENMVSFPMYTSILKGNTQHFTIVHHLTGREYFKTQKLLVAILGYIMERISLRIMYRNSNFIAVSNHTKDVLVSNGINKNKIDIVNPGIRDNFFSPGEKSKVPEIFYVGRYSAVGGNKKVDHLIEAFKTVNKEIKDAKLIIAGKGDGIEILKEQAKGYNVEFIGMIDDEQKREHMQRAWVFASPSLAEGFGITWIEANACGTPVVAYKIEGLDTVNEKTSIMVNCNDIEKLAVGILRVCESRSILESMKVNCIENGNKYTWRSSCNKFINILLNNR